MSATRSPRKATAHCPVAGCKWVRTYFDLRTRRKLGKMIIVEEWCGNDGQHVAHSAHYLNFAADIRSRDLGQDEQMLFGLVLSFIAPRYKIVVFDERATPGQHWHVQTAASAGA